MTSSQFPESRRVVELLGLRVHVAPWVIDEVGRVAAECAPAHAYAIITDQHVGPLAAPQVVGSLRHYAPHTRVLVRAIAPGEQEKTRESWSRLTDWLLDERCGRDTAIIALGGGVVGDLAGFVAATFMRGIPYLQVPTSLLAMVDASVGGKVGVDTHHGKNLVGAFHQPAAVLVDPTVLQTLPHQQLRAGLAEVVKHGIVADRAYLERAVRIGRHLLTAAPADVAWHGDDLADLIADSVRIKARIVAADEREGGLRQMLNFGHTVGHAIELRTNFSMLHGEAIAIGMCVEARIAETIGVAQPGLVDEVRNAIDALGLPTRVPSGLAPDDVLEAMQLDKKARSGRLVFALPRVVGAMAKAEAGGIPVDSATVVAALAQG